MEVGASLLVLVTYDVATSSKFGARRLRKVAKLCENYGVRVQNSVFECIVDNTQLAQLKIQLLAVIEKDEDSLRFYYLGTKYKTKVEHFGCKIALKVDEPLIF